MLESNAIILAGGDSKRIGREKATLKLGDSTLIEIIIGKLWGVFQEIILVTDAPKLFEGLPVSITGDVFTTAAKSSLRGVHAGLSYSSSQVNFVMACDMPFLSLELVKLLNKYSSDYQAVVPRLEGYYQPLFAFYQRTCLEAIEYCLYRGYFKVSSFFPYVKARYVTEGEVTKVDPFYHSFFNINTPQDYQKALELTFQEDQKRS